MLSRLKFEISSLISEILDQLPSEIWTSKTTTFLDPAIGGGQFIRAIEQRLRAAGHSDSNINGRVYGCENSKLSVQYAKNKYKLVATLASGDFLEKDFGTMKFDVIVGNPPYQRSGENPNSHALWEDFLEKSMSLVDTSGYLAFITPYIGRRKIKSVFIDNDVKIYKTDGVKNHFNVGSTFCYYVIQNSKNNIKTKFMKNDSSFFEVEFPDLGFIPNDLDEETLEFLKRMTTGKKLNIKTDCGIHSSNKSLFSDKKSSQFKFEFQHTSSQTRYGSKESKAHNMKKVVCSKSGYLKPHYDDSTIGVTEGSWIIPVSSKKEASSIINFLNSDEVKRFFSLASSNQSANDPAIYKLLAFE